MAYNIFVLCAQTSLRGRSILGSIASRIDISDGLGVHRLPRTMRGTMLSFFSKSF